MQWAFGTIQKRLLRKEPTFHFSVVHYVALIGHLDDGYTWLYPIRSKEIVSQPPSKNMADLLDWRFSGFFMFVILLVSRASLLSGFALMERTQGVLLDETPLNVMYD